MSQEKAQLIAPLGNMSVPGVTATGVITATSLDGNIVGSAAQLTPGCWVVGFYIDNDKQKPIIMGSESPWVQGGGEPLPPPGT